MATRLFVSNLPDNAEENDLREAFSAYGEITNLDLKCKSNNESKDQKKFAFITLSGSNYEIESCIKHFSCADFNGNRLYVTRARESFLERLQRERELTQKKDIIREQHEISTISHPVIKLGDKLNSHKRKLESSQTNQTLYNNESTSKIFKGKKLAESHSQYEGDIHIKNHNVMTESNKKKYDSDKKRMESIKQKRQEFRTKQMIIKTGLTDVDKLQNKKIIFSDNEEEASEKLNNTVEKSQKEPNKSKLFDDDDSDNEVNFEIKTQFEGKKGQKVLDLQSRYKSDKRFILDERFIEDDHNNQNEQTDKENDEEVELGQDDEKTKQFNILENLLGVAIKKNHNKDPNEKQSKPKLGMLRFDPSHPEHAKFLVSKNDVEQVLTKKAKKKLREKVPEKKEEIPDVVEEKVEVSKEQFYKISDTLKDAIVQPTTFSLRSLFPSRQENDTDAPEQNTDYIPLVKPKQSKVKNPLDPGEKNPFVYDSSDSDDEDMKTDVKQDSSTVEPKAVWKENLFFSHNDNRLKEGLAFFNNIGASETQKERKELKSLVKKRIYNKERKNQMFHKKIGGRKKTMKKSFRRKN